MMNVVLTSGREANTRSKAVDLARATELVQLALRSWPDSEPQVVGDGDMFRVYYWRDRSAALELAATKWRDAQPGQEWEARVSGHVVPVLLKWIGTRPSSFSKVNRKKFTGVNTTTGRDVSGDLARLRRRVK